MSVSLDLLVRHGCPCPYCGKIMRVHPPGYRGRLRARCLPTRDHVAPKGRFPGGPVAIVCLGCNNDKGGRTLPEWLTFLRRANDPRALIVAGLISRFQKEYRWAPGTMEARS